MDVTGRRGPRAKPAGTTEPAKLSFDLGLKLVLNQTKVDRTEQSLQSCGIGALQGLLEIERQALEVQQSHVEVHWTTVVLLFSAFWVPASSPATHMHRPGIVEPYTLKPKPLTLNPQP